MELIPPKPGQCPICATSHTADEPHNAQSLYYQYRFRASHGRWPTWADAIAHCQRAVQAAWRAELENLDVWTEPAEGEPIADPPAESICQLVTIPGTEPIVVQMHPPGA